MKQTRMAAALLSFLLSAPVFGQSDAALPATLSGRWSFTSGANTVIDSFSIVFEGNRTPGTVPGRLTWRGVNCGAKDEPIQAQWDGSVLKFEALLKANTNTQRMNGNCGADPGRWELKRKGDRFEGEARFPNSTVSVTAGP